MSLFLSLKCRGMTLFKFLAFIFLFYYINFFTYHLHVHAHRCVPHRCEAQRESGRKQFSTFTLWVLGIELRSSNLAASTCTS